MVSVLSVVLFSVILSAVSQKTLGFRDRELSFSSEDGEYHYRDLKTATVSAQNMTSLTPPVVHSELEWCVVSQSRD